MKIQSREYVVCGVAAVVLLWAPFACSTSGRGSGSGERASRMVAAGSVGGSGVSKVEVRPARGFQALRVEGAVDTFATVGSPFRVTVTCDDNLVPLIDTHVEDGVLVVSQRQNLLPNVRCSVDVTMPALAAVDALGSAFVGIAGKAEGLKRLNVAGSGNVAVADASGGNLHVTSGGSGSVRVERLVEGGIDVDLEGSGSFQASGAAKHVGVIAGGSGGVSLDEVTAEEADVACSGSGNVSVTASRSVRVRVSGSGNVRVAGNPPVRDASSSGTGTISFE